MMPIHSALFGDKHDTGIAQEPSPKLGEKTKMDAYVRRSRFVAAIFVVCSFGALGDEPRELDTKRADTALKTILAAEKTTHNLRYRAEIKVTDDVVQVIYTEEFESKE